MIHSYIFLGSGVHKFHQIIKEFGTFYSTTILLPEYRQQQFCLVVNCLPLSAYGEHEQLVENPNFLVSTLGKFSSGLVQVACWEITCPWLSPFPCAPADLKASFLGCAPGLLGNCKAQKQLIVSNCKLLYLRSRLTKRMNRH